MVLTDTAIKQAKPASKPWGWLISAGAHDGFEALAFPFLLA
ncbi:hypothetical protein [Pseudomonas syringae]|uniref:Integrase n=1 Tax=Pseudomonas syringae pv. actinidiae TaxID=103796 RepID=A0A2V0QFB4_PSESF|nr:hypothetical protein [Pseudomonas syringae]EGH68377.1 hypothetical protein PSYAC_26467 [Pseudomonas syringae pv. actinidiae str. M302091]MDG6386931.1 hypothetical protein [Pseudomonas syringae]MDU8490812.1 hypothetical protein [Pseudomonas syringae pv. actinidiae]OSN65053.1 hypothetical protein BV349_03307 [Pseudomonas syringae pv. actinidiae]OSN76097.1 hypothetical protein BV351_03109 [Pseudomonas syringae pv. actinidiae]